MDLGLQEFVGGVRIPLGELQTSVVVERSGTIGHRR